MNQSKVRTVGYGGGRVNVSSSTKYYRMLVYPSPNKSGWSILTEYNAMSTNEHTQPFNLTSVIRYWCNLMTTCNFFQFHANWNKVKETNCEFTQISWQARNIVFLLFLGNPASHGNLSDWWENPCNSENRWKRAFQASGNKIRSDFYPKIRYFC